MSRSGRRFVLGPAVAIWSLVVVTWLSPLTALAPAAPYDSGIGCVVLRPETPLPVGREVTLAARLTKPSSGGVVYRWHLGGGADETVGGESFGDERIVTVVTFERGDQVFPVTLTVENPAGGVATCRAPIAVGELPALAAGASAVTEQEPPGNPTAQDHAVLAFADLGMHCMDHGAVPLSIRPPLSVVQAQVVERGAVPRLLTDSEATLRYSAASSDADPVLSPLTVELDGLPPLEGRQGFSARELVSAADITIAAGADVRFASGVEARLDEGFTVGLDALFEIAIDPGLEAPSINTTSRHDPPGVSAAAAAIRKSDLWDPVDPSDPLGPTVAATLFGVDPPADEGLPTLPGPAAGRRMPGFAEPYEANDPQPFSFFDAEAKRFVAAGIPLTPIDDVGRLNPYPLLRVQAVAPAGDPVLAAVDAVAAVSTDVDCRACHLRGGVGADPAARATEIPFVDPPVAGDRDSEESAAKLNILLLHDFKQGTAHAGGSTVLCASCHESHTLEAWFPVLDPAEPPHLSLSNVMHDQHGRFVVDAVSEALVRDAGGEPELRDEPLPGERFLLVSDPLDPAIGMEQNCFSCHPGGATRYFRGVMADPGGLKCSRCHGTMLAVGGLFEGDFDGTGAPRERQAWQDEPRCESCHLGDAVDPGLAGLPATLAFDPLDPAAAPARAANPRFAESSGALYRDSHGHGGVACAGCHGSPHAIWPHPDPAANDNVTALELQGIPGRVTECVVCHPAGSFTSGTLDGPHGLHGVGDPDWVSSNSSSHQTFASFTPPEEPDPCAPCHGADHLGTRLSRAFSDRELRRADGVLEATVAAGETITCGLCHPVSRSF